MIRQTVFLVLAGFALRIFLTFPGPFESKVIFLTNQADLRNYYWPAQAALKGENPYALWSSGKSGDFRADMAPLELLTYLGTVAVWNDPRAIQVLFALFDVVNIILLGVLLKQSPLRLPFQVFYAVGPLTVYNLVMVPEDKTILLTLTLLIFTLLLSPDKVLGWGGVRFRASSFVIVVAALLASFKWLSVFYLLPLLVYVSRDKLDFFKHTFLFAAILTLSHLPWLPTWSYVYAFRSARLATPLHIAPAVLLNAIGAYNPLVMLFTLALLLLLIYAFFWLKRIDIFETIALSVMGGILWTPDMDPVHLSIVVLCFLLIVNWTTDARMLAVWVLSLLVTAVYAISTHGDFSRFGLQGLELLTGKYGSVQMIVLSYVLFIAVFFFYLHDKIRGRTLGRLVLIAEDSRSSVP